MNGAVMCQEDSGPQIHIIQETQCTHLEIIKKKKKDKNDSGSSI